jgi:hypothetical protein
MTPVLLALVIASPGWVHRQVHPSYPFEVYVVGVGSAPSTKDEAKDRSAAEASARKDVLAQIQVSIRGEFEAYESEVRRGGQTVDSASFTDRTQQSVAGTLEGVRIVESYVDADTKTRYALAILSRKDAAEGAKSAALASDAAVMKALSRADGAGDGAAHLGALLDALGDAESAEASGILFRALTRGTLETTRPGSIRDRIGRAVGEMTFRVVSGDRQAATSGRPLPEPVSFELSWRTKPVPGVPMLIALDGKGRVQEAGKLDNAGRASIRVDEVQADGAPEHHLVVKVDWAKYLALRAQKRSPESAGLGALEARAAYTFKTAATARVVIAIDERIVWKDAEKTEGPSKPIIAPQVAALLAAKGVEVRPSSVLGSHTPAEIASAGASDLSSWLSKEAEIVVTGVVTSEFANRVCEKCPTFHKASGSIRAVDTRTGQTLAESHEPGKKAVGTTETKAGTRAIEEASKKIGPVLADQLLKSLAR